MGHYALDISFGPVVDDEVRIYLDGKPIGDIYKDANLLNPGTHEYPHPPRTRTTAAGSASPTAASSAPPSNERVRTHPLLWLTADIRRHPNSGAANHRPRETTGNHAMLTAPRTSARDVTRIPRRHRQRALLPTSSNPHCTDKPPSTARTHCLHPHRPPPSVPHPRHRQPRAWHGPIRQRPRLIRADLCRRNSDEPIRAAPRQHRRGCGPFCLFRVRRRSRTHTALAGSHSPRSAPAVTLPGPNRRHPRTPVGPAFSFAAPASMNSRSRRSLTVTPWFFSTSRICSTVTPRPSCIGQPSLVSRSSTRLPRRTFFGRSRRQVAVHRIEIDIRRVRTAYSGHEPASLRITSRLAPNDSPRRRIPPTRERLISTNPPARRQFS